MMASVLHLLVLLPACGGQGVHTASLPPVHNEAHPHTGVLKPFVNGPLAFHLTPDEHKREL